MKNYARVTQEAAQYLQRKCTEESLKELESHRLAWETLRKPVDAILHEIDEKEHFWSRSQLDRAQDQTQPQIQQK
jgi:hypothetical protein